MDPGHGSVCTRICLECGSVIEDGADFCYQCGATLKNSAVIDEDGNVHSDRDGGVCPACGAPNPPGSRFCESCGSALEVVSVRRVRPRKFTGKEKVALAAAIIPGAGNLFGLGHLVLGKWSRALMYLCMSAIVLYARWFTPGISFTTLSVIEIIGFLIYFRQATDLLRTIYSAPVKPPKGGDPRHGGE